MIVLAHAMHKLERNIAHSRKYSVKKPWKRTNIQLQMKCSFFHCWTNEHETFRIVFSVPLLTMSVRLKHCCDVHLMNVTSKLPFIVKSWNICSIQLQMRACIKIQSIKTYLVAMNCVLLCLLFDFINRCRCGRSTFLTKNII